MRTRMALLLLGALSGDAAAARAQQPQVPMPQPAVPEIFTLEGEYVRIAYNNEAFASMGYRMASEEVGRDWALLTVGVTLRKPAKDYKLRREHFSIQTPDGKTVALATQKEYEAGDVRALNMRARVVTDSINYFPADASRPCALRLFSDPGSMALPYDETEVSWDRVCMGRLYFHVPGGIQVGQHFLNIQFADSRLQVPFRTLSKEEEKVFRKKWEDIKKQHEAALKGQ